MRKGGRRLEDNNSKNNDRHVQHLQNDDGCSNNNNNNLAPVTKIYRYCDKHRRSLIDTPWDSSRLYNNTGRRVRDVPHRLDSGVSGAGGRLLIRPPEDNDDTLYKASAIIRKFQQRKQQQKQQQTPLDSPAASCLKSSVNNSSNRKPESPSLDKRRVNFEKRLLTSSGDCSRDTDERQRRARRDSCSSSSYGRDTPSFCSSSVSRRSTSGFDNESGATVEGRSKNEEANTQKTSHRRRRSSPEEDTRLLDQLNRLSVGTSTRCDSTEERQPIAAQRIVKPKDALRRASLKRMLVYPPEGQRGEPLTLRKKWSNIDCHVRGDPVRGFKYKVYYLQKFVSDKWFPDNKTGGPFRSVEDDYDYGSSDYG